MTERDTRKAALQLREQMLHELYMDSAINSSVERRYEEQLEQVMRELDEIAHEEQAEWGQGDLSGLAVGLLAGRRSS